MKQRIQTSSGAKWEDIVGYSRTVRTGDRIIISGTTSVETVWLQVKAIIIFTDKTIIGKIENILEILVPDSKDIVRTRIYVVDISNWEEVGRAHREFLKI